VNVEDILRESFLDAVQQHKQPDSVGRRLVAWTECLLSGNCQRQFGRGRFRRSRA
jgi:hypothetical protein